MFLHLRFFSFIFSFRSIPDVLYIGDFYIFEQMNDIDFIKNKLLKYTNDQYLIDELTQIVLIKINQHSYLNKNDNQYKKLINVLIKCVYVDYYRQNKSLRAKYSTIPISELSKLDFNKANIQSNADNKINFKALLSMLDTLTQKEKEIIMLRFYFNLKFKNIAKILSCPKNTALSNFHKAKLKLRKTFNVDELYL